jgi:hypothetical protein
MRARTFTSHWRKVRELALTRDGYRCQECGTPLNVRVHLDPDLQWDRSRATVDDCVTLCNQHSGRLQAWLRNAA